LDTAVNIAFPAITAAFSLDVTEIQWVVVTYVLTYASLMLGFGRLADVWGHSRVLAWGLAGSAVAFVLCGLAPSFAWFLAARVLQGVTVAMVLAATPALVTLAVAPELRGRALGIFQMSMAAGFALGPPLGGLLVAGFGWRAVYLFRVIPALLLALFAAGQPSHSTAGGDDRDLDLAGSLTLAFSVTGLLLLVNRGQDLGWASPLVLTMALGALGCFVAFLVAEGRAKMPVVDLALFRNWVFTVANLLNALANGTMFAVWLFVPYYLVNVLHCSAPVGGLLLALMPLATAVAAPAAGRLADRLGTGRLCTAGLALEAVGLWAVSRLDAGTGYPVVITALVVTGLGLGVFQVPNMSYVMGAIPRDQQGVAGGMSQTVRTLGVVLGVSGASMLFGVRRALHTASTPLQTGNGPQEFVPAFQDVFLVSSLVCLAACALSVVRGGEAARRRLGASG
jgi:EmrB/QacA subfamily drug resistance transporter